jgi:hypothetical protein
MIANFPAGSKLVVDKALTNALSKYGDRRMAAVLIRIGCGRDLKDVGPYGGT